MIMLWDCYFCLSEGSEYWIFHHYASKCWVYVEVMRVPPWSQDSCRTASICFQALSQALEWRPHCCAKYMDRMWWGAGTGNRMRKQESEEMKSAHGVAHSASGMSWENRAASLMGSLLQQFDWKPSQLGPVSVWNTMFFPAAMGFSWEVHNFLIHK